jgi:uncharacterized protein
MPYSIAGITRRPFRRSSICEAQISGPLVTDTALAALALENGAVLCSTDQDFRRFKSLRVLDPFQQE